MRTPIIALRSKRANRGQHPGLLLQRYLCENATGDDGNPEEKRAILQAAMNAAGNEDVRALYRIAFGHWAGWLPTDPAPIDLATTNRLIVGLGSENVLETGIRLQHTYGMPIIPGSALKGLAAHYCDQIWGERHIETPSPEARRFRRERREVTQRNQMAESAGDYHRLLFGTTDDSGYVTFHDAWLTPDSTTPLVLDVMTPHHPKWLDGSMPPTDFDSPTPVPFLAVTGVFRVAVSWHGPTHVQSKNWTELALSLVCEALKDWGVGGKTTSGYGRLVDASAARSAPRASLAGATVVQRTVQALHVPKLPQSGDWVETELLPEKTAKGGWKARHASTGITGPVINSSAVPSDKQPGEKLTLIVNSAKAAEISFKYPLPSDAQKREEQQRKPRGDRDGGKGGRGGSPPRGGRR